MDTATNVIDQTAGSESSRKAMIGPAIAAFTLAAALFSITLGGSYIYDDWGLIFGDSRVADPALWHQFWTRDFFNGSADNLFRPLVSMSYAVQFYLHGDRPWAFHLVNVLLHAGAAAAVAELARRLVGLRAAYVAGLLFAAHPVHIEAVAAIYGRAECVSTLFIVVALVLMATDRPLSIGRALAIWLCTVAALLSKEQGLLLPLMLLALMAARRLLAPRQAPLAIRAESVGTIAYANPRSPGRLVKIGPFLAPAPLVLLVLMICWTFAGYLIYRERILKFWWDRNFLDWTVQPMIHSAGADRWLMPIVLLGRYALLLVAPHTLTIDYGVLGSVVDLRDPYLYAGIAAALAWIVWFFLAIARRDAAAVFCLLGLGLAYGLVGNIVTLIGANMGERLMYLPSAFFLILIASLLVKIRARSLATGVAALVVAVASVRTMAGLWRWNDPLRFYEITASEQPQSARLQMLLAEERTRRGDVAGAEVAWAEARRIRPDYYGVWEGSTRFAIRQGQWDDAERYLDRAFDLRPTQALVRMRAVIANGRATTRPAASRPAM